MVGDIEHHVGCEQRLLIVFRMMLTIRCNCTYLSAHTSFESGSHGDKWAGAPYSFGFHLQTILERMI